MLPLTVGDGFVRGLYKFNSHRARANVPNGPMGAYATLDLHMGLRDKNQAWEASLWVPGREALASADYYQGFLLNAGNGKRYQHYPEKWATALREMADLRPELLLPAHGKSINDPVQIHENLSVLAEMLQYIVDYTLAELKKGTRKELIAYHLKLPERLANHPTLNVQ